ncbi:14337_t:CDS:2, partial [Gigaspora margarita]
EIISKYLGPPSKIRRPNFLKISEYPSGLELDIYYPEYGFAIEVQGQQHKKYIDFFHRKDPKNFIKQQEWDQLKKELCEKNWRRDGLLTDLAKYKCPQTQKRNLVHDNTKNPFPSVEEIKKWKKEQVIKFLESKKDELELEEVDINIINRNRISGSAFLLLTDEKLRNIGLSLGPAITVAHLVKEISKAFPPIYKESNDLVYVFVDNSNIAIEGKYTVGNLEHLGSFDYERNSRYFNQLCIDYGRLLKTVQHEHKLGCAPVIVGSRPPQNDSIWRRIQEQGYEVTVFDRDPISYREKEVDIKLAISAINTITINDPGILILVTGDRDYTPLVETALENNWIVQTWFWTSGMSSKLRLKTRFYSLDNCYRSFAYGQGPDPTGEMKVLEITDGNIIKSWEDENLIEWFNTLNLFGWWNWFGSSAVQMYFDNQVNLEMAKNYIKNNYQKVQVREKN